MNKFVPQTDIANLLTNSALDPYGKIPEFKYCAARIEQVLIKDD
jgi:formate dehydrogenase major subunit